MSIIANSELILNPDGSIYHLNLLPEQIAHTIITVGDPDRVESVSKYFDSVEVRVNKREFVTHTGHLNGKRISVISTGIGTDNIDIVFNELDALVNIDLATRQVKKELTSLDIIRIGTSGCLQEDIPIDSYLISTYGIGLEGLIHYYDYKNNADETLLQYDFMEYSSREIQFPIRPYIAQGNLDLMNNIGSKMLRGITVTCSGFYAPQGRSLRCEAAYEDMLGMLANFKHKDLRITNFEMETSGIYGMARLLGHRAVSCNALIANRVRGEFSANPAQTVDNLIKEVLAKLTVT